MEVLKIMLGGKSVVKLFCMFSALAAFAMLGFLPETRLAAQSTGARLATQSSGAVYVLSNQSGENSVIVYHRNADGILEPRGTFPTGGSGLGSGPNPLDSQYSLVLSGDNRMLFAVNAGSDSITAFAVSGDSLTPLQTISSGGTQPISLSVHHDLLYVLNVGGATPNITGFRIVPEAQASKTLVPIVGSTQSLPNGSAASPAEISFSPDGRVILVTEPGVSQIASFTVSQAGQATLAGTFSATANGPFGLVFSQNSFAVTANTANGAPQSGSMSSYRVSESAELTPVSSQVMNNQTASTWATATENGRIAFTSNTMSGTISSYAISPDTGNLTLDQPVAASLQAQDGSSLMPTGMALSNNGRYLYVRNGGNQTVSGFLIHGDGSLTPITKVGGLPDTAAGIVAR
jgi:6-phosphogluconolactonase (cycloisomerase 2 family)